jgi:4-amino-4-deoxy-L-arabinose transferase-like glycosyltransferase
MTMRKIPTLTTMRSALSSALINSSSATKVILITAIWLAITAGLRPLTLPDEGRYGGVVWEMFNSGNWLVPLLDGMPFFHKPPLFYWISACSVKLFGVTEWAIRIPSILAGILSAGGLFLFLRHYRSSMVATLSVVILVTQPIFFAGSQFANLDMLVAGIISLTILSGADALIRLENKLFYRLTLARTFVLAALGVLAKGLIGIVLPGAVIFVWLIWRRQWRSSTALFWPLGWVALLSISAPWFLWMQHSFSGFFDYFFVYQHFKRFSETGFNNQMPFWFYVPVVLICALPWSPWIWLTFNKRYWHDPEKGSLRSLMAIWLVLILVFFSLPSSKLVGYIMPILPPFAYFIADGFAEWIEREQTRAISWFVRTTSVAVATCLVGVIGVSVSESLSAKDLVLSKMRNMKPEDQLVILGKYQYDLAIYSRASRPAWVVDNWSDPKVKKQDNWRKELSDAAQFDRQIAESNLISGTQFTEKFCNYQSGTVWIWAEKGNTSLVSWLSLESVAGKDKYHELWRFTQDQIRTHPACADLKTSR